MSQKVLSKNNYVPGLRRVYGRCCECNQEKKINTRTVLQRIRSNFIERHERRISSTYRVIENDCGRGRK